MYNPDLLWETGCKSIEARGPEGCEFLDLNTGIFCFTRLAINGLNPKGMQPFQYRYLSWMCNGEIYNAKKLGEIPSGSDCEVLGQVWEESEGNPVAFCRALDGVFSLVLHDMKRRKWIIARDPCGVRPLFYTKTIEGYRFASERKALEPFCTSEWNNDEVCLIEEFPPGTVWSIDTDTLVCKEERYHTIPWLKNPCVNTMTLRLSLESAVKKRLFTERPVAALLSGGIDSSLIAALVQRELLALGKPPLKTFSIGMPGSTDLYYARKVAEWIKSDHTEVLTTADEMFSVIPEVIRDIESYDITTVRASVGNWMVAREIKKRTDCKVVFNGDGSDEIFGSYLYFFKAPSDYAFEQESERLLEEISKYDVLRSDRSISSHGLEARTPFLDKQFVSVARSFPTDQRRPSYEKGKPEKNILRMAFGGIGLLPEEVVWRRKEAFSDGVSCEQKSWFQEIQERIENRGLVPEDWESKVDELLGKARWLGDSPKPKTKEAYYYMELFLQNYQNTKTYWPYWMPKWSPETGDPSARTLKVE